MGLRAIVVLLAAGLGVLTLLVSAHGMWRLHGVHQRMQAMSVGATVGMALLLLSAGIYFDRATLLLRMLVLVALYFMTAPIATSAIARAAYRRQRDRSHEIFFYDDMANPAYTQDSLPAAPPSAASTADASSAR